MKKLSTLIISFALLVVFIVGGATFAYFTSTASNTGNSISAGTLNVEVRRDRGESYPGPLFYTDEDEGMVLTGDQAGDLGLYPTGLWYPGKGTPNALTTEDEEPIQRLLNVYNRGSVWGKINEVWATMVIKDSDGNIINDPTIISEFANNLIVTINVSGFPNDKLYEGTLAGLIPDREDLSDHQPCVYEPELNPNGEAYQLAFSAYLKSDAGNEIQGVKPYVNFWLNVEQR